MKLWKKEESEPTDITRQVEEFTVGNDRLLDLQLAPHDVAGSIAHVTMLCESGIVDPSLKEPLVNELRQIHEEISSGKFVIEDGVEDVHSMVELLLTRRLGDAGKMIHCGRSRNDQVLLDIKLYMREELKKITNETTKLFALLCALAEKHKEVGMPGYTHLQVAMPSSFGLWFGAYAESLTDDIEVLSSAFSVCNRNPLGSAAGYGSSFPLNRQRTTELLGFDGLNYNVIYAQMGRGKSERIVVSALGNLASTIGRLAMDATLYMSQNFGFISFPESLTTGSSIMPHKKNLDVLEIISAKCNRIISRPNEINLLMANLPSGYHRDLQLIKDIVFPTFTEIRQCIKMMTLMLENINVNRTILDDEKYRYIYSVEEVNRLVMEGMPFMDAYQAVGKQIASGHFHPTGEIRHTHQGSIGNLCLEQIQLQMKKKLDELEPAFNRMDVAIKTLIAQKENITVN